MRLHELIPDLIADDIPCLQGRPFRGSAELLIKAEGRANVALKGTKGNNGGFLMVTWGWGIAVFSGVYVAAMSGAHLNPAVTFGLLLNGKTEYAPGVPVDAASTFTYFGGELLGAFLGAVVMWLAYKQHFDASDAEPASQLAVFSTGPAIRSTPWNLITEIVGTFVLVFVILTIGVSLGGPTGYAINPARDLGPRIAHALLPMKGKGSSDWSYSWIPVVGPLVGGGLAGLVAAVVPIIATAVS